MEAPHKWNEAWADFFIPKGVPVEYAEKATFLEEQMKQYPKPQISIKAGDGFPNIDKDFRRKKAFGQINTDFSDVKDDDEFK